MKTSEKKLLSESLKGAGRSARRKAFKANLPVAILENGKVMLIYRDGRKAEAKTELPMHSTVNR